MRRTAILLILAPLAATAGCVPDASVSRPAVAVPAHFGGTAVAARTMDYRHWWRRFDDPVLVSLVERALANNSQLLQAVARIRQARAQQLVVGSARSPSVDATGGASYTRISENAVPPLPGTQNGQPSFGLPGMDFTTFRAGFDASWEVDLFGGQEHEEQASAARTAASQWQMRDVQVALAGDVAATYLDYRSLQEREALADRRLASERELLELAEARFRNGLESSDIFRRQQQQVADAAAAVAGMTGERAMRLHALGLLIGQPPRALAEELAAASGLPQAGFDVPPGLPSELLLRRPDLRAAEEELAASLSDIGAARAALFPKITLTGALHLVSTSLANLIAPGSLQLNGGAAISLPLLDGGRRRATVALRQGQAEELSEVYRGRVLAAFRDVEDALARLESARRRQMERETSLAAARHVSATEEARYRNRLVPLSRLVEARQVQLAQEDALAAARAANATSLVALYKALGGGWIVDGGNDG